MADASHYSHGGLHGAALSQGKLDVREVASSLASFTIAALMIVEAVSNLGFGRDAGLAGGSVAVGVGLALTFAFRDRMRLTAGKAQNAS